jgi:hypothetical protein
MTTTATTTTTTAAIVPPAAAAITPPAPETTPAAPQEQENASRHFAAIAKREHAVREKEKALKEQGAKYADYEAKEKLRRENPDALLSDYGYTLDDLIKMKANGGKPTAEQLAQKALEQMEAMKLERVEDKKRIEDEKKALELQVQQEKEDAAVQGFKEKISAHLQSNTDKYEFILNEQYPVDLVYEVIDRHYEATKTEQGTGRILSFEEAADLAEKYLETGYEKKLTLKKIQAKVTPKEVETAAEAEPINSRRAAMAKKEIPTLSNDNQNLASTPKEDPAMPKDPRLAIAESKRKAAALLRWGG